MKRKLIIFLTLCLLLTCAAAATDGIDFNYSGVENEPEPIIVDEKSQPEQNGYTQVSASSWYDMERHMFITYAGDFEVASTVANGMCTVIPVSIRVAANANARLYRDGVELGSGSQFEVETPGSYVLSVNLGSNRTSEPLKFTLLSTVAVQLTQFRLPAGFYFDKVIKNGEDVFWNGTTVDMSEEGDYRIEYICDGTGIPYTLDMRVDHTPPSLALEAVVDGEARGPVDISDLEEGAKVYVTVNGEAIQPTAVLTQTGRYELTVEDAAGNSQTYFFSIRVYFNGSAIVFMLLAGGLIAALVVYLIRSRKGLRIR